MFFLDKLIDYGDTIGPALPLITICIMFRKRKIPSSVKVLTGYLLFCIVLFTFSNFLADRRINNLYLYHIFSVVELTLLTFYFQIIFESKRFKTRTNLLIIIFIAYAILNSLFLEGIKTWNSNVVSIEFLILIIYSFIYYFKLTKTEDILAFNKIPDFWLVSGLFIYFSTTVMFVTLYKYAAIGNVHLVNHILSFQVVMYLIKNVFLTKGILCFKTMK